MARRSKSPKAAANSAPRVAWIALAVLLVAFAVRAMFLFASADRAWPHSALYEGDAPVWVQWAGALDRSEPFEYDLPMRTPGVAFLLYWIVPGEIAAPFVLLKLLWCALSATTCALLFLVVRRETSQRAALIAAGFLCFSFGAYEAATSLNNEALYALVLVAIVGLTLRSGEQASASTSTAVGVLHGLALLLRAEHALLLVLLLVYGVWRIRGVSWAARARSCALVAASAVVVCLPWAVRSHDATVRFNTVAHDAPDFVRADPPWTPEARAFLSRLPAFARGGNFVFFQQLSRQAGAREVTLADVERYFDEQFGYVPEPLATWTLSSSKGPLDFALANDPRSEGGFSRAALLDGHDPVPVFAFGRPSHLKLYNHGYAAGLASIRADLAGWLALVGRKLVRFWDGMTLGWTGFDWPYGRESTRRPIDLAIPRDASVAAQLGVAGVIVAGVVLALRRRLGGVWSTVILYKLVVTVFFYGYARQAVSIAPAFFVFAAIAIDAGLARLGFAPRVVRASGAALVVALVACDVVHLTSAVPLEIGPARADALIVSTPQWEPGAFQSFDEIVLVPRAR